MNDEAKVVKLVTGNPLVADQEAICAELQTFADELKQGDWGVVNTLVVLIETGDGRLRRRTVTVDNALDKARLVGLLSFAVHHIIDGD